MALHPGETISYFRTLRVLVLGSHADMPRRHMRLMLELESGNVHGTNMNLNADIVPSDLPVGKVIRRRLHVFWIHFTIGFENEVRTCILLE